MKKPPNPYVIGNSVGNSSAFVGRSDVLREVLNILRHQKQNAILLFGQRRIGKTSVLRELEAKLPTQGDFLTIFFDLQDQSRRSLGDILQALAHKISDNLSNINPNLDNPPEEAFRNWLVNVVSKAIEKKRIVLLLDEFDALASYDEQQTTNAFFPYLRGLLESIDPEKINFVFAVGRNAKDLNEIAGSLFKGIMTQRISLLKKEDTLKLIHLAKNHLHWSTEAIEHIWQQTNGHPFITQCLCYTLWYAAYANNPQQIPEITLEKVNHAIPDTLEKSESAFEWLWAGLGPAEQVVAAALASAGAEPKDEKQLKHLLQDSGVQIIIQELQDAPRILQDWDLIEETDEKKYRFRVELLRRWIAENKPLHQAQGKLDALDPEANELYKVAKHFYNSKRFEAAIGSLRQVISINPHHVKAHLQLADILIKQRQDNEAREILEQLYDYNPAAARDPLVDVLMNLAKLSNNKREQRQLYERVLEIEPKNEEAKDILYSIQHVEEVDMVVQIEDFLNRIVEAKNGIDAIFVSELSMGFLLECSQTQNGREPELTKTLRGPDGNGGEAFAHTGVFQSLQRQMDAFGQATGYGNLELSILQFGEIGDDYKGILVLYVYRLSDMLIAIGFLNTRTEGDNLAVTVLRARQHIKPILELVKQKYG